MPVNMAKTILYFFVTLSTIGYITNVACPPAATSCIEFGFGSAFGRILLKKLHRGHFHSAIDQARCPERPTSGRKIELNKLTVADIGTAL